MRESARTALAWLRANAARYGLDPAFQRDTDVHLHVQSAEVPKEGASAGVTMAAALVSAFTRRPVRTDVAMTGEITLGGQVLPVGGIAEKVLAAHRGHPAAAKPCAGRRGPRRQPPACGRSRLRDAGRRVAGTGAAAHAGRGQRRRGHPARPRVLSRGGRAPSGVVRRGRAGRKEMGSLARPLPVSRICLLHHSRSTRHSGVASSTTTSTRTSGSTPKNDDASPNPNTTRVERIDRQRPESLTRLPKTDNLQRRRPCATTTSPAASQAAATIQTGAASNRRPRAPAATGSRSGSWAPTASALTCSRDPQPSRMPPASSAAHSAPRPHDAATHAYGDRRYAANDRFRYPGT